VRRGVSIMDVGTLGKFLIGGADATAFLERLYPCRVADLAPGRIRYTLVLNEAGYVFDDGLICALGAGRYYLTFTSGGAEQAESWLRDWAETWGLMVHIVNRTAAVGAINVAGPRARELLFALGASADGGDLPYLGHREIEVAGVPCRAIRLGFVGELSYELHHPSIKSVRLWDALLDAGGGLEIRPHGLEALRLLRLEKGHVIVGQDTDFDTTPAKLGLDRAVKMDKEYFIGKTALGRVGRLPLERRLVGVVFDGNGAPPEGMPLQVGGRHVGYLTSSRYSPVLGHGVALAWLRRTNGVFPERVDADAWAGRVVTSAFYDPTGKRLRA
ncbi:MAG: aminomethyltransferase family protein, partial [Vicinamibacterales bacterium]